MEVFDMSKYKFIRLFLLIVIIECWVAEPVFAGAWTREKGGWYHQVSGNYYKADEKFDEDGNREDFKDNGEFTDRNMSYYVEYGICDDLTAIGSWPYKWLEYEDDTVINKTDGFSDLELALKYRLFSTDSGVCAVQGLVKIPEAYDEDDAVPLGNAQYDYEIRLLYGLSLFPKIPGYLNIETGYRFRAEEPADELKYLLEFGLDITKKLYGRIKLDGTLGMDNADNKKDFSGNPAATYDYDLGKLDVALGWKVMENWGMEIGCRPDIYGENTSAGTNWSLSVICQML
jgi:protein XagA